MKKIMKIFGALLLLLSVASCHDDADTQFVYAYTDEVAFGEAENSFAGKYRVLWKAININYGLWDYEKECGVDWDAEYDKMLPKFEALDEQETVTDKELQTLLEEMVTPLHDGHMVVYATNHKTGEVVRAAPSSIRNAKRADKNETEAFETSGTSMERYYKDKEIAAWLEINTTMLGQFNYMTGTDGVGYRWASSKQLELSSLTSLTTAQAEQLSALSQFVNEMSQLVTEVTRRGRITLSNVQKFNSLVAQYGYLNIPFLEPINTKFEDAGVKVTYALFNDGIAYFSLSGFSLTDYLSSAMYKRNFTDLHSQALADRVKEVWSAWYGAVQGLYKTGKLKGVIVDVRNNGGGYQYDAAYVLGSMLPSGGYQVGYKRYKRGLGRYDYSPMMPFTLPTLDGEHAAISDLPIVVLADGSSVSMAELTAQTCKVMPNGCVIGRRTHGGLCGLMNNPAFSYNYSGHIGKEDETPVAVYMPLECFFDMNKKSLEGVGVEPDIEVAYDKDVFLATGHDTQLDRALEYIRTGK